MTSQYLYLSGARDIVTPFFISVDVALPVSKKRGGEKGKVTSELGVKT